MAGTRATAVRRVAVVRVLAPALALVLAFAGSVAALNASVYGAGGFVTAYLEALGRGSIEEALGTAGVELPDGERALLVEAALHGPQQVRIVAEEDLGDGRHRVTAEYVLEAEPERSDFVVEPDGARFGLFRAWRFAEAPVATLAVRVLGDYRFQAGGVAAGDPEAYGEAQPYLALVPSVYELYHRTTYLEAPEQAVLVLQPGATVEAVVEPRPTEHFVTEVQTEVDAHLDACAEQTVLLPAGCPFGASIDDRVLDEPSWRIVAYPGINLERAEVAGVWRVPVTAATARLQTRVQSIFDGSIRELDQEEGFAVSYDVTIRGDDSLLISAVY